MPRQSTRVISPRAVERSDRWMIAGLVVVVLLVYGISGSFNFITEWDDGINVAQNPLLQPPNWVNLRQIWLHAYAGLYLPVTYTVWWLIAQLAQINVAEANGTTLNPYLFHVVNVVTHATAVTLVHRLLRQIGCRRWPAFAGAMLFAIHPLQVEPAVWITGLKDLLSGMLGLAALSQYLAVGPNSRTDNEPESARSRPGFHYVLATTAYVASLLAKPSAVVLPLIALVLDRWFVRQSWRRTFAILTPWLVLAAACVLWTRQAQPLSQAAVVDRVALWLRPLVATDALAFYLWKLFFPFKLSIDHGRFPSGVVASGALYITWIVPVFVAAGLWLTRRRLPHLMAGGLIMGVALLPVLGFVPFEFQHISTVADRYFYLAMLGPALAVGFGLDQIWRRLDAVGNLAREAAARTRRIALTVTTCLLAAAALRSAVQTLTWRDSVTVFQHAVKINPQSFIGYTDLSQAWLQRGDTELALQNIVAAAAIRPNDTLIQSDWGNDLVRLGRFDEAEEHFHFILKIDPGHAYAKKKLSQLAAARGKTP